MTVPYREIRARYTDETVTVYQAYARQRVANKIAASGSMTGWKAP